MDDLQKIQDEIANLQRQAEQMIAQRRAGVIEEIKAKIKSFGLTAKDLGLSDKPSIRAGVVVPVKYRQGEQTWTGRGRQPRWVEEFVSAGGDLETLRVN